MVINGESELDPKKDEEEKEESDEEIERMVCIQQKILRLWITLLNPLIAGQWVAAAWKRPITSHLGAVHLRSKWVTRLR